MVISGDAYFSKVTYLYAYMGISKDSSSPAITC